MGNDVYILIYIQYIRQTQVLEIHLTRTSIKYLCGTWEKKVFFL